MVTQSHSKKCSIYSTSLKPLRMSSLKVQSGYTIFWVAFCKLWMENRRVWIQPRSFYAHTWGCRICRHFNAREIHSAYSFVTTFLLTVFGSSWGLSNINVASRSVMILYAVFFWIQKNYYRLVMLFTEAAHHLNFCMADIHLTSRNPALLNVSAGVSQTFSVLHGLFYPSEKLSTSHIGQH